MLIRRPDYFDLRFKLLVIRNASNLFFIQMQFPCLSHVKMGLFFKTNLLFFLFVDI